MDNGNALSRKARRYYVFNTHSFHPNPVRVDFSAYPIEDQEILIKALQDNFSIAATIQKNRRHYTLYIRSKSANRFVDLIRPYLHSCFLYKIQNN